MRFSASSRIAPWEERSPFERDREMRNDPQYVPCRKPTCLDLRNSWSMSQRRWSRDGTEADFQPRSDRIPRPEPVFRCGRFESDVVIARDFFSSHFGLRDFESSSILDDGPGQNRIRSIHIVSYIATTRLHPALPPLSFTGKQLTLNPKGRGS